MRNPSSSIETASQQAAEQAMAHAGVGEGAAEQRERAIKHISQLMEMALARYQRSGDLSDLAEARRYRQELEELKRARPALAVRLGVRS